MIEGLEGLNGLMVEGEESLRWLGEGSEKCLSWTKETYSPPIQAKHHLLGMLLST